MSYADLQASIGKPCANFQRALPQGYAGFRRCQNGLSATLPLIPESDRSAAKKAVLLDHLVGAG
jgi:hypothetical protein